ncbi:MAG TPA: (2Fe-2S)-binding protein [Cyclobacteriaceae bacterium]|nr:(2Fe-2S)-binding protein [Cyclobacteriaceae bacterium]
MHDMKETIHFELNHQARELVLERDRTLLWVLRTDFGLTGTKFGCGLGYCGACTVLIDNKPVRSCMTDASLVDGKKVITIEGLGANGKLHPIQEAFAKNDALQCGYCTPGMILAAYGLLSDNPTPDRREIREGLEENLCRCGAHKRIIDAVEMAAADMKGGK